MPLVKKMGIAWVSEETNLWRYMDLARFVSMLQSRSLYFPSVSQLAKTDPYEGRFPYRQAAALTDPKAWKIKKEDEHSFTEEQRIKLLQGVANRFIPDREGTALFHTFVSCWHANTGESDAMWRLYTLQGQGIAIRTTFKSLRTAIEGDARTIYAGRVKYLDYGWHSIDVEDEVHVVFHKRGSFSHEQEVRLAYQIEEGKREALGPPCITVPLDLATVIEQVFVSPKTPEWVVDVVAGLVGQYGLNENIVSQSPLYQERLPLSAPS